MEYAIDAEAGRVSSNLWRDSETGEFGYFWEQMKMRYMVRGYKKQTGKIQEGLVHSTYVEAFAESQDFLKSDQYEVIVILADSEGADHPDNAGKFFLRRIVK